VIILEESLGAEFVGAMGGMPLTPHLDQLLEEGLAFDQLYATGTRSVRGIEALITGFYPTPARSVVKLPKSQRNFFSVASLLGKEGYSTSFIYGGESHFDNMGRFFTGNGFDTVIDQTDYDSPLFEGSWGVSDQDLFRRAHEEFEALGERSFFSLVFSSSNHSPWEFPLGDFELHEEPVATRNNAVKYADHALGEFFEMAKASSYWNNTVFLVVADHNSRVYGPTLVPVEHFHIPAVFLGGTITPEHVNVISSQVDLLPTALSLIGLDSDHPALGRDLTNPAIRALPGRALLQFHQTNLFLEEDHAVILRSNMDAGHFRWIDGELRPAEPRPESERRALAHTLWPQLTYREASYRLP
jgi:phosphoglycerol transferase MdoB-like AlkP superfamily enzyme